MLCVQRQKIEKNGNTGREIKAGVNAIITTIIGF